MCVLCGCVYKCVCVVWMCVQMCVCCVDVCANVCVLCGCVDKSNTNDDDTIKHLTSAATYVDTM